MVQFRYVLHKFRDSVELRCFFQGHLFFKWWLSGRRIVFQKGYSSSSDLEDHLKSSSYWIEVDKKSIKKHIKTAHIIKMQHV